MSGFNDFMGKAGAFASKAAGKAKDLASVAAEKTKLATRVAKLNMDISGQKETIKKAYADLGKLYYEAHHDAPEGILAQTCQEIDMAFATIAAMEAEIERLKESDGEEAAEDAAFATVVDATAADADVEVEIQVEETPAPEAPAASEPEADPETPEAPEPEATPEAPKPEAAPEAPEAPEPDEQPTDGEQPPAWE